MNEEPKGLETLHSLDITPRALRDLYLITHGAFAPLDRFLGFDEAASVLETLSLRDGALWPIPVLLQTDEPVLPLPSSKVALRFEGRIAGTIQVDDVFAVPPHWAGEIFGTSDDAHPGVAAFLGAGRTAIAGKVEWLGDSARFGFRGLTPAQTRAEIARRRWQTVVGFQTRNPIHRAHEYLLRTALEIFDGLLLHPLVGETRDEDIPADVRLRCYRALVDEYLPPDRVLLTTYDGWMRYAGPREAVLHALVRRNFGCTHFLVGRDHAGVGNYYGPHDAHRMLRGIRRDRLGIDIIHFDNIDYCSRCQSMVTARTCAHAPDRRLTLSGTEMRRRLRAGEPLPEEITRPEIAAILREAFVVGGPS